MSKLTVLGYGKTRSGKTRFFGTWPKPYVLADGIERGFDTFQDMEDNDFFEKGVRPVVREVYSAEDYMRYFEEGVNGVKEGKYGTIVTDSLTFYADQFLATQRSRGVEGWDLYRGLLDHLRHLVIEAHKLPANICWICLVDDPRDSSDMGGPLIPGKFSSKLPAMCSAVLYFDAREVRNKDTKKFEKVYRVHTKDCGKFPAGVRQNSKMMNPLENASYRMFLEELGRRDG